MDNPPTKGSIIPSKKKLVFPEGFLWGSATSSHQVEGGNLWNDWYDFELKGKIKNKEVSGVACDHYNRYREDFDLAKSLNQNAQRLSIEWSRIEKQKGTFDKSEIEHYKDVLKYLKDNGFVTFVTLHHFTSPLWMANEGGWSKKRSVEYFKQYVKVVVPELDQYVDFWATINEPTVFTTHGYITKAWPPSRFSIFSLRNSLNHLAEAHNGAYEIIKEINPTAQVGIVHNFAPFIPAFYIFNRLVFWARNFQFIDKIQNNCDYIGVNYYFPVIWFLLKKRLSNTDMKWPIYPKGLYGIVKYTQKRYKKPIYITENGIADSKDNYRKIFIKKHLKHLHRAISEGCDVRGYFYWSLLDNFEWAEGFKPRFGLIEVNYENQERKMRDSANYYAEICKNNYIES